MQCKGLNKRAGVETLRELEASIRILRDQIQEPVLGMLVTQQGFTNFAMRHCQNRYVLIFEK